MGARRDKRYVAHARRPYATNMATCDLDGVTVYFEQAGAGERLLFISGTGGDLRHRPSVFDGPLGSRYEVLAYDQRGLGRTSVPDGPYTMADYANDAAGLVTARGWDFCLAVGVSFGGMVAQELAIRHPDLVERLVLVCTSPGGAGGASIPFDELANLTGVARATRQLEMMDTRWNDARRETHAAEWKTMVDAMSGYLGDTESASHSSSEASCEASSESARGSALQLEARRHHDTWERLGSISCPTLVCGGRYDGIAAPQNSEHLAERIPGAQLALFEGGHQFLWQDSSAYPRILAFLAGDSSDAAYRPEGEFSSGHKATDPTLGESAKPSETRQR
jgi:3-oxoadipate enol-lactonase